MHSLIHEHLAHASGPREDRGAHARAAHRGPPPGRLRTQAARALAALAGRLDKERARRAVA